MARGGDHHDYKEVGICVNCRVRQADAGYTTCSSCRDHINTKQRSRRFMSRMEGLCVSCGKNKADAGEICSYCRKTMRRAEKKLRDKRRKEIMCTRCGGEIPYHRDGLKTCGSC